MPDLLPADTLEAVAARFRLLGDPVRLRLLSALVGQGELSVQELAAAAQQSHQNTSKHLRILAEGGLVGCRREGIYAYYRVTDPTLPGLCALVCGRLEHEAAERNAQGAVS